MTPLGEPKHPETMHEVSVAHALLGQILEVAVAHGARAVTGATLSIGELTCLEAETLRFAFEALARDTLAAECTLAVVVQPLEVQCPACGRRGEASPHESGCPACGSVPVAVVAGRDLRLLTIDVDDGQPED